MLKMRIPIEGMSCAGCVRSVERALSQVEGVHVETVEVGAAVVTYDPSLADDNVIIRTIERAGFVAGRQPG